MSCRFCGNICGRNVSNSKHCRHFQALRSNISPDVYVSSTLRTVDANGFSSGSLVLLRSFCKRCYFKHVMNIDIDDDSHLVCIFLVEEKRTTKLGYTLNLPGGKRDTISEDPVDVAVREVVEESGGLFSIDESVDTCKLHAIDSCYAWLPYAKQVMTMALSRDAPVDNDECDCAHAFRTLDIHRQSVHDGGDCVSNFYWVPLESWLSAYHATSQTGVLTLDHETTTLPFPSLNVTVSPLRYRELRALMSNVPTKATPSQLSNAINNIVKSLISA